MSDATTGEVMELANDYKSFFDIDLNKLPTSVLRSIGMAVHDVLNDRKGDEREARNISRSVLSRLEKSDRRRFHSSYLSYLDYLLEQDWTNLFSGDMDRKYYVYLHVAPAKKGIRFHNDKCVIDISGMPFYVGKGTGNRAFDLNRNEGHGVTLRRLKERGFGAQEIVYIVKNGLTEPEALALESQLIHFFGTKFDKRPGILVNLDIPVKPDII